MLELFGNHPLVPNPIVYGKTVFHEGAPWCQKILGTIARAQYLPDRQAVGRAAEAAGIETAEFSREHPGVLLRLYSTGRHHLEFLSCAWSFSLHPWAEPAQPFSRGTLVWSTSRRLLLLAACEQEKPDETQRKRERLVLFCCCCFNSASNVITRDLLMGFAVWQSLCLASYSRGMSRGDVLSL